MGSNSLIVPSSSSLDKTLIAVNVEEMARFIYNNHNTVNIKITVSESRSADDVGAESLQGNVVDGGVGIRSRFCALAEDGLQRKEITTNKYQGYKAQCLPGTASTEMDSQELWEVVRSC